MKSTGNPQIAANNSLYINGKLPDKIMLVKIGLAIGAFIFSVSSVIPVMIKTWSRYDYSHGPLIPAISLYWVWLKREQIMKVPVLPNLTGGTAALLAGSLTLILAKIGSVAIVQLLSIIVIIAGITLLLLGTRYLRALALPIAYLVLSVPVLDLIHDKISYPLQIFYAKLSYTVLNFANVPLFRHAQYLELPSVTLEIAPGCSGISFLISFIAIGIPLAFFTQKRPLRRALLVAFAIFCCLFANLLRITLIGFWTYHGGEFVHGPFHIFIGGFISVVGFIFLFTGAWFFAETRLPGMKRNLMERENSADITIDMKKFNRALFVSVVVLFSLGGYLYLYEQKPVALKRSLSNLDYVIGQWKGSDAYSNISDLEIERADSEITRVYRSENGREVKLHIGYFASQTQGKEFIFYTLEKLYHYTGEILLPVEHDRKLRINRALMENGPEQVVPVLYWYDVQGRIISNRYAAKFLIALNGFIYGRTNGALIMIYRDNTSLDNSEQVVNDEMNFAQALMPVLDDYLPGH
jgi:EpsI family protein